jgi:hypothetical protein
MRTEWGGWRPNPVVCTGPFCPPLAQGPAAPAALRSRHCDCVRLGMRRAECLMPVVGVADEDSFEAYSTQPPEGKPRTCAHAYVLCIALVRSTEDCDW